MYSIPKVILVLRTLVYSMPKVTLVLRTLVYSYSMPKVILVPSTKWTLNSRPTVN